MATYTLANITDPLGNPNWSFDGSNFFTGAPGVGITIGFVTPVDEANSVNVTGGYYVNSVNISATYLTQTAAAATYAPIASPTFTGTATAPTIKATTAFDLGSVNIVTGRAKTQTSPASPTGTISTTFVMMGLAGAVTPTLTGTVLLAISGILSISAASAAATVRLAYGTGTAPINGAAAVGTVVGGTGQMITTATGNSQAPFTCIGLISGLTVGTAIWIDAQLQTSNASDTAIILDTAITAVEI